MKIGEQAHCLVPSDRELYGMQDWWSMTKNVDLNVMHVGNTTAFPEALDFSVVSGSTLLLDFPYFHHPVSSIEDDTLQHCWQGDMLYLTCF